MFLFFLSAALKMLVGVIPSSRHAWSNFLIQLRDPEEEEAEREGGGKVALFGDVVAGFAGDLVAAKMVFGFIGEICSELLK